MKISNETKIGALAAVSIALLILGFNFLKGQTLFEHEKQIFAVFTNVNGLVKSNPVKINGFLVGKVGDLKQRDKSLSAIIVPITLNKEVDIPDNSVAFVDKDLLGTTSLVIKMGNSNQIVKDGDTLVSADNPGMLDNVQAQIAPAMTKLNSAIQSLEVLITNVNSVLDPNTKNNIQSVIANSAASTAALRNLLATQTGTLAQSLANLQKFSENLNKNNEGINKTVANIETATSKLAKADIDQAIKNLENATKNLSDFTAKVNSKDGSLGMLMNDKALYNNIENTVRSLNTLLDDLRVNPKRYVNISLIGRKNKGGYLEAPLNDTLKK